MTLRGAVLDLDGVLTNTAALHERAWKETFDPLLQDLGERPFQREDYRNYIDGKPRLDGVRAMLLARSLPCDEPRVRAIGEEKNRRFLEKLDRYGVELIGESVEVLERLRARGWKVAIVSSSRNAARIVEASGVGELIDALVSGQVAADLGLEGKPAPDLFLEALRRIDVPPERALGVEDAEAGIEALVRARVARIIGLRRTGPLAPLRARGANAVVRSLDEIALQPASQLGSALHPERGLLARLAGRPFALFVDYDGTLTRIVEDPAEAVLSSSMRAALHSASKRIPVAVISGRGLEDVRQLVDIQGLWYAGSHGFEILAPDGEIMVQQGGIAALPDLDIAEQSLRVDLAGLTGVSVERKPFAIAVHYRRASAQAAGRAIRAALAEGQHRERLVSSHGKEVVEIRPDVAWDKGRALDWLFETITGEQAPCERALRDPGAPDARRPVPVYIGDDRTDEDAFWALRGRGFGVIVGDHGDDTAAHLALEDTAQVRLLIEKLCGEAR